MYSVRNANPSPAKRSPRKLLWFIVGGIAILLVAAIVFLEVTNRTFFFHKRPIETQANTPDRTAGSETKGEAGDSANDTKATNPAAPENADSQDTKHEDTNTSPATGEVKEPTGNFVNNHRPEGNPMMQSVCVTTPGATCQITFTKGDTIKTLPAQTTDRGGATYWTWTLRDDRIGLSDGSWKVEAKATLGGKTKTTADPINLEIK